MIPFLRHRISRRSRKAVVLILTLWLVVVLSIIASSLAFDVQVNSKLALLQKDQLVAYNLAKSGVAAGMTHLQNDRLIDEAENPNQPSDSYADVWAQPELKEDDRQEELGKGTYEFVIVDDEGRININVASVKVLKAMMEFYGYEPPDSDDIAQAIIDWRDPDDQVPSGAGVPENEYYSGLVGQKVSSDMNPDALLYRCRNESFLTTEELLDVVGITPELFYGYDPQAQEEEAIEQRNKIAQGTKTRTRKKSAREQTLPIKDIVTVGGKNYIGRININTAPREVLTILIHAGSNFMGLDVAESAADSIISYRGDDKKGRAPDPDAVFHSPADIAKVPGLNSELVTQLSRGQALGQQMGFGSKFFRVFGTGRAGRVEKTIEVLVYRELDIFNPDDARLLSNKGKSKGMKGGFASRGGPRKSRSESDDNYIRIPATRVRQWLE